MENPTYHLTAEETQQIQYTFMNKVYSWMSFALAITGLVAYLTFTSPILSSLILGNPIMMYGVIFAEVGIVIYLSSRIQRMEIQTALGWFLLYSGLNGLTLSALFFVYTLTSIASTFFITAATFATMSLYGYTTKRDLTKLGSFLIMGLIGVFIATVVNWFLANEMLFWIISYAGVLVFIGLTAWDTQKLKKMSVELADKPELKQRAALMGALTLYLDFINLFIFLLSILGNRK